MVNKDKINVRLVNGKLLVIQCVLDFVMFFPFHVVVWRPLSY